MFSLLSGWFIHDNLQSGVLWNSSNPEGLLSSFRDKHSNLATFQLQLEVMMFMVLSCLQEDCLCPRFSRVLTSEGTFWAPVLNCIHIVSIDLDALIQCAKSKRETWKQQWGARIMNIDVTPQELGCIEWERHKLQQQMLPFLLPWTWDCALYCALQHVPWGL